MGWNEPSDSANSAQGDISTSISMELLQGMVLGRNLLQSQKMSQKPENVQKEPEPENKEKL